MPKFNPISRWSERNQLLVLSLVVGIVVGLAAVLLKTLISVLQEGLRDAFGGVLGGSLYYLALPGIGMLLAMLFCKYVIKDSIGHGVTKALQAVSRHESRIKPHNMWSSVAASSVTIGFGGSVGAEAPIVYTGAAIGSNFARYMGLSYRSMTVLLGCGAAAAVAGIFKAPLAGVLFVLEILLFNISMTSMIAARCCQPSQPQWFPILFLDLPPRLNAPLPRSNSRIFLITSFLDFSAGRSPSISSVRP